MRWSLQQQLITSIVVSWIIAGVAGSTLVDEVTELERREPARNRRQPAPRPPSPQRRQTPPAQQPARGRALQRPAGRPQPAPRSRSPAQQRRTPAAQLTRGRSPQRAPRPGPRSPSVQRGAVRGAPSQRAAARAPFPYLRRGAGQQRIAANAQRRVATASSRPAVTPRRATLQRPAARRGAAGAIPRRIAGANTRSPSRANGARQSPVRGTSLTRNTSPARGNTGAARARAQSGSRIPAPVRRAGATSPRPRTPQANAAIRSASRIPVRRTSVSGSRSGTPQPAARGPVRGAAQRNAAASVRTASGATPRGATSQRIRPTAGQTQSRIPVRRPASGVSQRGALPANRAAGRTRLCRRDDGPCSMLPGNGAASQQTRPPRPHRPGPYGTTFVANTLPAPLTVRGTVTAAHNYISPTDLKSSNYRATAKNQGTVWVGPGQHSRYPNAAAVPSNQEADHKYEGQQMVNVLKKAGVQRWEDIPNPAAQNQVKNFLRGRLNNKSNLVLVDKNVNGPKGSAITMAQSGRQVNLDAVTGSYVNDHRMAITREARRTQQQYDSMRLKWNRQHTSTEYMPKLDFVGDNAETLGRIN